MKVDTVYIAYNNQPYMLILCILINQLIYTI